jgi:hypothetical protein
MGNWVLLLLRSMGFLFEIGRGGFSVYKLIGAKGGNLAALLVLLSAGR